MTAPAALRPCFTPWWVTAQLLLAIGDAETAKALAAAGRRLT